MKLAQISIFRDHSPINIFLSQKKVVVVSAELRELIGISSIRFLGCVRIRDAVVKGYRSLQRLRDFLQKVNSLTM
jgi:replicative superfamily II helicase